MRRGVVVVVGWLLAGCGGGGGGGAVDGPQVVVDGPRPDGLFHAGPAVQDMIALCAWTTSCLSELESPGVTMSACLSAVVRDRLETARFTTRSLHLDYSAYEGCVAAAPPSCGAFRDCLVGEGVLVLCAGGEVPTCAGDVAQACDPARGFGRATDCAARGLTCLDGGCGTGCDVSARTCAADGAAIQSCDGEVMHEVSCGTATCHVVGGEPLCLPGVTGTCDGADTFACEGGAARSVGCTGGVRQELDCIALGQECYDEDGRCGDRAFCNAAHADVCAGDTLTACLTGKEYTIDCAALGATCGALPGGAPGCVIP